MKRNLTDKFIRSIKPAPAGKSVDYWDTAVPNFGVRVSDRGAKSFIVYTRWPGSRSPARRTVGDAKKLSLADARRIARGWLNQVEQKVDPRVRERAEAMEEARKRRTTFLAVAEAWFADELKTQRKAAEVERDVRREFVARWGSRPITEITTLDIRDVIKAKAVGLSPAPNARKTGPAPAQARNLLGHIKQLLSWAVEQHAYGLERSPADPIRGARLIGKKARRRRVLSDDELREVWEAAEETEYPYGPLFRMLILTGQRKSEVGEARWREFDFDRGLWTIPAERMKMDIPNVVPLFDDLVALLRELPRFKTGDYLFSTTFGQKPVNGYSKAKERLDAMLPASPPPSHWVIHDLRRTMRTGLSALPIPDRVREMMIAHAPPGLHAVYDQYKYVEEKRRGFALWSAHLRGILQPPTSNVIELHRPPA